MTPRTDAPPARAQVAQQLTGILRIDCGVDGSGRRVRAPRAKYECLLCRTVDGPHYGAENVTAFVRSASADHRARCTARQENHT
ncbi:hypothetical protein [Streptomyces sp. 8L]|uniref:hypothetical protein n=1 Tax=Streptomyces sp. 8L TaxID=2877242 RepID=UPI001CD1FFD9|nr:hypothetical protein [Streptomyces sp. 8L]MCA1218670.1 hypothetical protein [Streptomyces sp. 8L]